MGSGAFNDLKKEHKQVLEFCQQLGGVHNNLARQVHAHLGLSLWGRLWWLLFGNREAQATVKDARPQ